MQYNKQTNTSCLPFALFKLIMISSKVHSSSVDKYLIEKVLYKKCIHHSEECCDSIDFSLITSNPRVCKICIEKNNIAPKNIFPIKSLLSSHSHKYFSGLPMLSDASLIENLKSICSTVDKATKSY